MTLNDSCLAWLHVIDIPCSACHLPLLSQTLRYHSLPCLSPHGVGLITWKCALFLREKSLCPHTLISRLPTKATPAGRATARTLTETDGLRRLLYCHQSSSKCWRRAPHTHWRGHQPRILGPLPELDLLPQVREIRTEKAPSSIPPKGRHTPSQYLQVQ